MGSVHGTSKGGARHRGSTGYSEDRDTGGTGGWRGMEGGRGRGGGEELGAGVHFSVRKLLTADGQFHEKIFPDFVMLSARGESGERKAWTAVLCGTDPVLEQGTLQTLLRSWKGQARGGNPECDSIRLAWTVEGSAEHRAEWRKLDADSTHTNT